MINNYKITTKNKIPSSVVSELFSPLRRIAGVYKIDKHTGKPVMKWQQNRGICYHRHISKPKPQKIAVALSQFETFRKSYLQIEQIQAEGFRKTKPTEQEKYFISQNIRNNLGESAVWRS